MIQLWYTRIGLDRHNNHTYMRISRPCCGCGCGGEFAGTGRTDSSSITSIIITTRLYCNNNTHKQNKNTHIIVSFTCGMDPVLIYSVLSSWYGCGCGGNTYTILLFTCGIYSIHEQQQRRWHRVPYHVPTVSYNTHAIYSNSNSNGNSNSNSNSNSNNSNNSNNKKKHHPIRLPQRQE